MAESREFNWIESIARWTSPVSRRVLCGIGDDAAVMEAPKGNLLATVDMMVEGVHFDLSYFQPEEVGHKLLAMSLSDIAAMGGTARYAMVSLGIPATTTNEFIEAFYRGLRALGQRYEVDVVGGNLSSVVKGGLVLDLCLLGESDTPILRSGACPGDAVAVTGNLGAAAAGLSALRHWGRAEACQRFPNESLAQLCPEPRVQEARQMAALGGVTSLIDISDGLTSELHHLASASGVGFQIECAQLPITQGTRQIASELGGLDREWALHGGEDYELLLTVNPGQLSRLSAAFGLTLLGTVTKDSAVLLIDEKGKSRKVAPGGWQHPF